MELLHIIDNFIFLLDIKSYNSYIKDIYIKDISNTILFDLKTVIFAGLYSRLFDYLILLIRL
jgi:hypothetical protein